MKKIENGNLMDLDIQKFAETADNDSTDVVVAEVADGEKNLVSLIDNEGEENFEPNFDDTADNQSVGPDNSNAESNDITQTKAFANRLREETEKVKIKSKEQMDTFAKSRGFENWDELQKANEEEKISKLGIEDTEAFESFLDDKINNNPIVLEAKSILEQQKQTEMQRILNSEIQEIAKMDSSIKTLNDLANIPEYDDLMDKAVNHGYSLSDAFKVVSFNRIKSGAIKDGRQSFINNLNSKSHLKNTSGSAGTEVVVPNDVMATYRKNMPNMTEEEIKKDYANFQKGSN